MKFLLVLFSFCLSISVEARPGGRWPHPPGRPQADVNLQPGQQQQIDWQILQQYGGRVTVSCEDWNTGGGWPPGGGGGWPPGGGGGQVTIPLGPNSCGNGAGACACVTPGVLYRPNPQAAENLCAEMGYRRMVTFQTAEGQRGVYQCSSMYNASCFVNQNPGNLVCISVTCSR